HRARGGPPGPHRPRGERPVPRRPPAAAADPLGGDRGRWRRLTTRALRGPSALPPTERRRHPDGKGTAGRRGVAMSEPTAADVMGTPPAVVHPELCLRDVARCLEEADVGAAIVTRDDRVEGVISERDVVRALAGGADPDLIWAADVMTPEPIQ